MYFITAIVGFAVELSLLKLTLAVAQVFLFVYAANRLLSLQEWYYLCVCFGALLIGITGILFIGGLTGWSPIQTRWGIYHQNRLAVLSNPNSIAMVALAAGLLALWADRWPLFQGFADSKYALLQYLPWGIVGMAALVLLWSASRTSQVAFLLGLGIWVLASRQSLYLVLSGGVLATVLWLWRSGGDVVASAESLLSRWDSDTLLMTRGGVWEESLRNWQEHPWFGHGFGVTEGGFEAQSLLESVGSVRDGSGYFGVLESIGMVGMLALLTVYAVVAWNLYRLGQGPAGGSGRRWPGPWGWLEVRCFLGSRLIWRGSRGFWARAPSCILPSFSHSACTPQGIVPFLTALPCSVLTETMTTLPLGRYAISVEDDVYERLVFYTCPQSSHYRAPQHPK